MRARGPRPFVTVLVLAALLTGCRGDVVDGPRPYDSVTAMFEDLGGEQWCGTELRVTFADAIGSCGPPERRVLLSTAYPDRATLLDGVGRALGEELLVLVPADTAAAGPWFDVRAADPVAIDEVRAVLGGVVLDGDAAIESWIDANDD